MKKHFFSHITNVWASLIIETLYHRGVREICIAPGSRSAPLTIAAANLKGQYPDLSLHCHFDERGLGFFAQGLSKSKQQPVAVITTSGTAVPNLHPSVIEAYQTQIPLIILSADRPPELLNCGANQAIQQDDIFGRNVVHFQQLDLPCSSISAQTLINRVNHTLDHALGLIPRIDSGPVQINTPFREPLYGTNNLIDYSDYLESCEFLYGYPKNKHRSQTLINPASQGLIIAGALTQKESVPLLALAQKTGWPILVDITSQLRLTCSKHIIQYTDFLLANNEALDILSKIKQVIQFGGRLTSKRLNTWLGSFQGYYYIISPHKAYLDPHHRAIQIQSSIENFCEGMLEDIKINSTFDPSIIAETKERLTVLNLKIDELIEQTISPDLSELSVVRKLSYLITPEHALFLGNSLSIRMMDMVALTRHGNPIYTNRGASGIDGLVASSIGCSHKHTQGLTLLLGDLSLLHDLNSLAMLAGLSIPFIIIVLNNDGGAIFNLLPTSQLGNIKTDFFQCPHGFEFKGACDMFSIEYYKADSLSCFTEHYENALAHKGASLIEINTPCDEATTQIKLLVNEVQKVKC